MGLSVSCVNCHRTVQVKSELAGKTVRVSALRLASERAGGGAGRGTVERPSEPVGCDSRAPLATQQP